MEQLNRVELDKWFYELDSRELAFIFPSLFDEIVQDIDYYEEINEFIDACDDKWDEMSHDEKLITYNEYIKF